MSKNPVAVSDMTLKPFQKKIIELSQKIDYRYIDVMVDSDGCSGKSWLSTYIGVHGIGRKIRPVNDYKDFMRIIYDTKKMPLYVFDLPRAMNKDRLCSLLSGIEILHLFSFKTPILYENS